MSNEPLRLILRPSFTNAGHRKTDLFDAYLGTEKITTSRQPLFDGARVLQKMGYPDCMLLTMRHHNRDYDSIKPMTIGDLARGTIREDKRGLHLAKYQPMPEDLKKLRREQAS
ncbi:MAG: hypothetical protein ACR2RF_06320 [Geminicoccaceae bacterium]